LVQAQWAEECRHTLPESASMTSEIALHSEAGILMPSRKMLDAGSIAEFLDDQQASRSMFRRANSVDRVAFTAAAGLGIGALVGISWAKKVEPVCMDPLSARRFVDPLSATQSPQESEASMLGSETSGDTSPTRSHATALLSGSDSQSSLLVAASAGSIPSSPTYSGIRGQSTCSPEAAAGQVTSCAASPSTVCSEESLADKRPMMVQTRAWDFPLSTREKQHRLNILGECERYDLVSENKYLKMKSLVSLEVASRVQEEMEALRLSPEKVDCHYVPHGSTNLAMACSFEKVIADMPSPRSRCSSASSSSERERCELADSEDNYPHVPSAQAKTPGNFCTFQFPVLSCASPVSVSDDRWNDQDTHDARELFTCNAACSVPDPGCLAMREKEEDELLEGAWYFLGIEWLADSCGIPEEKEENIACSFPGTRDYEGIAPRSPARSRVMRESTVETAVVVLDSLIVSL